MSDKTVMFNSPEAAQYRTDINGWVSRRGCYFGEGPRSEEMARYDGCTHTEKVLLDESGKISLCLTPP